MQHLTLLSLGLGAALAGLAGGFTPPLRYHLGPTWSPDALPWAAFALGLAVFALRPGLRSEARPDERLAARAGEEQEGLLL